MVIVVKITRRLERGRRTVRVRLPSNPAAATELQFLVSSSDCPPPTSCMLHPASPVSQNNYQLQYLNLSILSLLLFIPLICRKYNTHIMHYYCFSGLAIASALVTLGNPRKVSLDPTTKMESKLKGRKSFSNQHPDSCI